MIIILKNKHSLKIDNFKFKCCVGKKGIDKEKTEGDKKTPKGIFGLEKLYYRNDRIKKPFTKLKCIKITKNMGWCNNVKDKINYNQLINTKKKTRHEKLYRRDFKYDLVIPIKYNWKKRIPGKGSCIFLHLTKNYKSTEGCIALSKKDFLIMLKLINTKTKIKIC
jgi:L,D-peptidoglycan transpeptidase YkuD (ErfK/YbiS/YcfS/YnhG family)